MANIPKENMSDNGFTVKFEEQVLKDEKASNNMSY